MGVNEPLVNEPLVYIESLFKGFLHFALFPSKVGWSLQNNETVVGMDCFWSSPSDCDIGSWRKQDEVT